VRTEPGGSWGPELRPFELLRWAFIIRVGARSNGRKMDDFPSPAFLWSAGLLALLVLALGPALDGASLVKAVAVPALMAVWAGVVVLIDRWVVRRR
jgi:hypothetical protein